MQHKIIFHFDCTNCNSGGLAATTTFCLLTKLQQMPMLLYVLYLENYLFRSQKLTYIKEKGTKCSISDARSYALPATFNVLYLPWNDRMEPKPKIKRTRSLVCSLARSPICQCIPFLTVDIFNRFSMEYSVLRLMMQCGHANKKRLRHYQHDELLFKLYYGCCCYGFWCCCFSVICNVCVYFLFI